MILVARWYRHDGKLSGHVSCNMEMSLAIKPYLLELYGVWHHLVVTTYSPNNIFLHIVAGKKSRLLYDHNAQNWWWQLFHRHFRRSKVQSHLRTKERIKQWPFLFFSQNSPNTTTLFINIRTECKCSSSLKKTLFEKLPSIACCSSTHSTTYPIYHVVNSHLSSVVAWAGLYMDVGVDLNAKYAIMCRKTVLIPENDEESTHSGLRKHLHLQ